MHNAFTHRLLEAVDTAIHPEAYSPDSFATVIDDDPEDENLTTAEQVHDLEDAPDEDPTIYE